MSILILSQQKNFHPLCKKNSSINCPNIYIFQYKKIKQSSIFISLHIQHFLIFCGFLITILTLLLIISILTFVFTFSHLLNNSLCTIKIIIIHLNKSRTVIIKIVQHHLWLDFHHLYTFNEPLFLLLWSVLRNLLL